MREKNTYYFDQEEKRFINKQIPIWMRKTSKSNRDLVEKGQASFEYSQFKEYFFSSPKDVEEEIHVFEDFFLADKRQKEAILQAARKFSIYGIGVGAILCFYSHLNQESGADWLGESIMLASGVYGLIRHFNLRRYRNTNQDALEKIYRNHSLAERNKEPMKLSVAFCKRVTFSDTMDIIRGKIKAAYLRAYEESGGSQSSSNSSEQLHFVKPRLLIGRQKELIAEKDGSLISSLGFQYHPFFTKNSLHEPTLAERIVSKTN